MNPVHEYKGFRISKRSGNSARRGYKKSGYVTFINREKIVFSTLKEAKGYIDKYALWKIAIDTQSETN